MLRCSLSDSQLTLLSLSSDRVAINFVSAEDVPALRDIEKFYATQIDEVRSPLSFFFKPPSATNLHVISQMPLNVADLI